MEYQLQSFWLWSINCGVSDSGVSVVEFLIEECQLWSFWSWSISCEVSDSGVSTTEFLIEECQLWGFWQWSINFGVSDHGVSAAEFLAVKYQMWRVGLGVLACKVSTLDYQPQSIISQSISPQETLENMSRTWKEIYELKDISGRQGVAR